METQFIKKEDALLGQQEVTIESESCLICSNQCDSPLQACWSIDTFKSLLGRESRSENECLSSHLLSIFILRNILNYPKAECEDLLRTMGVVHPGDWFRLCEDCSEGIEKILESLKQIANLKQQIANVKKKTRDKLRDSLRWEKDSIGLDAVMATVSARNIIRLKFQAGTPPKNSFKNIKKSTRLSKRKEEFKPIKLNLPTLCDIDNGNFAEDSVYIPEEGDDFSPDDFSDEDESDENDDTPSKKIKRSFPKTPSKDISPTTHKVCDGCHEWVKKSTLKWHMRRYHPLLQKQRREEREKLVHRSAVPIYCNICGKSPVNESALRKHMRKYHRVVYNQRLLEQKTSQELLKFQTGGITHECDKCTYTCFSENAKNYHDSQHRLVDRVVTKSSENQFTCSFCSAVFPNLKEVYLHAKAKHGKELGVKSKKKDVTEDTRVGNVRVGEVITTKSETEFSCKFCSSIFTSLHLAARHAREMHREEVGIGQPRFRTKSKLKPYKCQHCTNAYKHPSLLQHHVKTVHDQVREMFCDKCGQGFTRRHHLNDHIAVFHSDTKRVPQVCDICGKEVPSQKGLRSHKRRWHGTESEREKERQRNGPQKCAHCGLRVLHSGAIKKHTREAHPELYIHMCSNCPQKFIRFSGLLAHQKLKH